MSSESVTSTILKENSLFVFAVTAFILTTATIDAPDKGVQYHFVKHIVHNVRDIISIMDNHRATITSSWYP